MKLLALFFLLCTAVSAANVSPIPIYDALDIEAVVSELGPKFQFAEVNQSLVLHDSRFVSPAAEIVLKWIRTADTKIDKSYTPESHDCDDLAGEALVFLRREFHKAHPELEYALLCGMATVTVKVRDIPELGIKGWPANVRHAVVVWRARGDVWWIWEPSTGKCSKLDEELFDGRIQLNSLYL